MKSNTIKSNPFIFEKTNSGDKSYDLSSFFFKDRKIFFFCDVDEETSESLIMQLLFLEEQDPGEEITIYIKSSGGSVSDGLAIYDVIQTISSPIVTVCMGLAASMAQLLLCAGTKGKRYSYPNARIMMHQPSGGISGSSSDIEIYHEELKIARKNLYKIISNHTGTEFDTIMKDASNDKWMSPEEAKAYGMIDEIIVPFKNKKIIPKITKTKNYSGRKKSL